MKKASNFSKIVAVLLIGAISIMFLTVSCDNAAKQVNTDNISDNGENNGANNNSGDGSAGEERIDADDMPFPHEAMDFGGSTFKILIDQEDINLLDVDDIDVEGMNGEVLNDAYYTRKTLVEDTYNVKLEGVHVNNFQISDFVEKSVRSGLDEYDAYVPRLMNAGLYAAKGYGVNLLDTNLAIDAPWWDKNIIRDTSVNNAAYIIAGDIFIKHYDGISMLMFNKKLLMDLGLENPYNLVQNNQWTISKFNEMIKGVALDLDGNGKMDRYDRYGFATQGDCVSSFINACGEKFVTKDKNDLPVFCGNSEKMSNIIDRMLDIYSDDIYCMHRDGFGKEGGGDLIQFWVFPEGRALFYYAYSRYINLGLRNMEDDFGILPLPKWDSSQSEYYSNVNYWHSYTYMIPITVTDVERSAYIIDAMAYHGRKIIKPAYYDVCLQRKYTRDEESSEMLDIIFASTVYDLGIVYDIGGYYNTIQTDVFSNHANNMMSQYDKLSNKIEKSMNDLIDEFKAHR